LIYLVLPLCALAGEAAGVAGLHGEWKGSGTDRNSAKDQPTPVTCHASNQAAGEKVQIKMTCQSASGREEINANLVVNQAQLTGSLTRNSSDMPFAVSGSLSGRMVGNTATFDVRALFKTRARITLAMLGRAGYHLRVADPEAGATLMNVTFRNH
jgi:hypothetical protein